MKTFVTFTGAAVVFFGLGMYVSTIFTGSEKEINLRFKIEKNDSGAPELVLNNAAWSTTASNCSQNDHPGCFDLAQGRYGQFTLTLNNGDPACNSKSAWRFHPQAAVTLGGESFDLLNAPKPGPADPWGDLTDFVAEDYSADEDSGVVKVKPLGMSLPNKDRIRFWGRNESTQPYAIWYKVTVQSCSDPAMTLTYDPRVENRGGLGLAPDS